MALRGLLPLILSIALWQQANSALGEPAPVESWSLQQLMLRLGAVHNATAHFVEHKYLHMLKKPLVASGTLAYVAPGRLQKDTLEPRPEHLVVDSDTLSIERDGKTQTLPLADYPQIGAFI